jgi:protein tyrosine/serine phosphatase
LNRRTYLRLVLAGALLALAANWAWNAFDNFHEVIPGELYRSGQLSAAHLQARARANGIRTVINLRGSNPAEGWYLEEMSASQAGGLVHIDLPIDSLFPTNDELRDLVRALDDCPKPVLVHCQSGIDRTGIASALASLLLDDSSSAERALDQLTWRFGCLPGRKSRENKRDFLLAYDSWLRVKGVTHSRQHFRAWLQQVVQVGDLSHH